MDIHGVINIVLLLLAIAAVWAVVELAVTFRRARGTILNVDSAVGDLKKSVDGVIEQVQPVITHVDEAVTQATPAIDNVAPLLTSATNAVDTLNSDLERIEEILTDASHVTGAASSATSAVRTATATIADRFRSRLGIGRAGEPAPSMLGEGGGEEPADSGRAGDAEAEHPSVRDGARVVSSDRGYFTYPSRDDVVERHGTTATPAGDDTSPVVQDTSGSTRDSEGKQAAQQGGADTPEDAPEEAGAQA
ncbi:MAG: hypothetical protein SOI26_00805 [Coriobacteriales bacterium]|jgi:uncharacterized protein YoxC